MSDIRNISGGAGTALPSATIPGSQYKKKIRLSELHAVKSTLRKGHLHSVCEEAKCPNRGECFSKRTATFLAMGSICTRRCGFCSIATGRPVPLDPNEPEEIARAAHDLALRHVVLTSVNRDELPDGGASHLRDILLAIKESSRPVTTEILTPDFKGDLAAVDTVLEGKPDVFNHNLETIPRLYKKVRPGAQYQQSLVVLKHAQNSGVLTKSGLMLGFDETDHELADVFGDMGHTKVDILTLGQYFQPTRKQLPVERYLVPEDFKRIRALALQADIPFVYAGIYVRSSYNAEEVFRQLAPPHSPLEQQEPEL